MDCKLKPGIVAGQIRIKILAACSLAILVAGWAATGYTQTPPAQSRTEAGSDPFQFGQSQAGGDSQPPKIAPDQSDGNVVPGEIPAQQVSNHDTVKSAKTLSQFDEQAAFEYLEDICKIGPRPSASPGMAKQQKYLQKHFEEIGGKFYRQKFRANNPHTGRPVDLHNLMVQWHPERTKRLLICCHHDTRPFADADKQNPRAKFIGANDGGSGVALLCELGKHMADMDGEYGVDFWFFDGEEFVIVRQRDPMFLGSRYFSEAYAAGKIPWKYEQAVLVDMVADKDLQIYLEGNSMHFAKALTEEIWSIAKKEGVKEFIPEQKRFIRDDHLALNEIARIPACDIIDFDYPNPQAGNIYWHTRQDKIKNCSAESLGKVGKVVLAWIRHKQGM